MNNWTKEQLQAIDARDSNLLVTAAAGSGKTAVLVERIIRMICRDGLSIENLLIVTFTNAAAGEMREKITAAIIKEIEAMPDHQDHLRYQLQMIGRSSICTLHAFCTSIVRDNFHLLDIDPKFRIGDTAECSILRREAVEEILEEAYDNGSAHFLDLVERFAGNRSDQAVEDLILRTHNFIQSQPEPLAWLTEKIRIFALTEEEFVESQWADNILRDMQSRINAADDLFAAAFALIDQHASLEGYRPALEDDLVQTGQLTHAARLGLPALTDKITALHFTRLGRVARDCDPNLQERAKGLRNEGKKILQELTRITQGKNIAQFMAELRQMSSAMQALVELVADFNRRYQEKKAEKGMLDFNDLEHYALQVLSNPDCARQYREKYQYIFVDEYQDSNLVQETLLQSIKSEHNLFMVGDVKQSIYRFRLADPTLFIAKYNTFVSEPSALNRRIDLGKNFRSRQEILDGINYLFKHIMSEPLGEIDYDESCYLYYGSNMEAQEDARIEVLLLEKDPALLELDEDQEELSDIEIEARLAAQRIHQLVGLTIYDPREKCHRPLQYRDMVILMRSTKNRADVYLDTLSAQGIPVYADVNNGYFENLEVEMFLNLLRIIDNKKQDIPLLSVLRSPLAKFTLEDLIDIRRNSRAAYLYQAAEECMQNQSDDLSRRLTCFWEQISHWKNKARFMPIDELIWEIMLETDYYYYVSAMPGGLQRQANLRILLDRARQFQTSSLKGLYNFLRFVDSLQTDRGGDMGNARLLSEKDNVVRIMSIHKSKGLEFPVVIMAGLGKQFNLSDTNAAVLFHKDLGIGPMFVDPQARVKCNSLARIAIQGQLKTENLSEEMRILYVGCTRAINKLILLGSLKNLPALTQKWSSSLNLYGLSKANTFMDWIGPVLLRHPDGQILRDLLAEEFDPRQIIRDDSSWDIKIASPAAFGPSLAEAPSQASTVLQELQNFKRETPSPEAALINHRLNWDYPYRAAETIPSKRSVSSIKKLKNNNWPANLPDIPLLLPGPVFINPPDSTAALSGAGKGTIMHLVMQYLDLTRVGSTTEIDCQLQEMIVQGLLVEDEMRAVQTEKIAHFFASSLGQRMLHSSQVYREVPFNLVCKAAQVLEDINAGDEELLVQGVIDLYFVEGDDLVLVDYKTDYISAQNRAALIAQYTVQINMYRQALESILQKKVKESYLYLFHPEETIAIA